jgi:PPOX class probable F420-dependent enzyme
VSKKEAPTSIQALCTHSEISHTVLLTSFRRNHQEVSTPVGMKSANGNLYFMTPASTWKTKRIAHNPHVRLALCTYQGKALSPVTDGTAYQLAGIQAQQARKLLCTGLFGFLMDVLYMLRYPGDKTAIYEVSLQPLKQHEEANIHGCRPALGQHQK